MLPTDAQYPQQAHKAVEQPRAREAEGRGHCVDIHRFSCFVYPCLHLASTVGLRSDVPTPSPGESFGASHGHHRVRERYEGRSNELTALSTGARASQRTTKGLVALPNGASTFPTTARTSLGGFHSLNLCRTLTRGTKYGLRANQSAAAGLCQLSLVCSELRRENCVRLASTPTTFILFRQD